MNCHHQALCFSLVLGLHGDLQSKGNGHDSLNTRKAACDVHGDTSMGYMEMKRRNQELYSENQGFRESLEANELKYQDALNMLTLERAEHKASTMPHECHMSHTGIHGHYSVQKLQSELKSELKHYQGGSPDMWLLQTAVYCFRMPSNQKPRHRSFATLLKRNQV